MESTTGSTADVFKKRGLIEIEENEDRGRVKERWRERDCKEREREKLRRIDHRKWGRHLKSNRQSGWLVGASEYGEG